MPFAAPSAIGQIRTAEDIVLFAPLVGEAGGFSRGKRLRFTLVQHESGGTGFGYRLAGEGAAA